MTLKDEPMPAAPGFPVERSVGRLEPERAVAVVTECEACFTPDVCQLRGTCDHYRAELIRIVARALPQQVPNEHGHLLTPQELWSMYVEDGEPPNAEVSGCLRAPMPEDAQRTAAGSPLDRPVGPVAGA